jgi:signal transduction histidine kinase
VNYPLLENAEDLYAWPTDEMRLQTIVGSLLHNAIKYSNGGGKVRVEIEKIGERLELCIVDNGIGIKKEDLLTLDQVLKNHLLKWTTSNGSGICLGLKLVGS